MKKSAMTTLAHLFVIVMLCCTAGRAQIGNSKQEPKPVVIVDPVIAQTSGAGYGVISNSTYQNDYFGLRITIPPDWNIQGDDIKQKLKEGGKAVIVPKDELDRTQMEAAVERTVNLLSISKFPLGEPGQFNALFMAIAEPVPLSETAPGYMKQLRSVLQQARVPITFVDGAETETLNGMQFYTLTVTLTPGQSVVRQKYYVILKKGYALGLITTIISESDTDVMNGILRSVTIK